MQAAPYRQVEMMRITDKEFAQISTLVHSNFGINLTEKKKTLVIGRLQKIVRSLGYSTFQEYYDHLKNDKSGTSQVELVNRISTNFTYFWREPDHFTDMLNRVLPEVTKKLTAKNNRDLRVWCAAAATGEEPYMLAMLLDEHLGTSATKWKAGLVATDISQDALQKAHAGIYPIDALEKLPEKYRRKYFKKTGQPGQWQVIDRIRSEVMFKRFNLMHPLPFKGKFHVIFCRNVMIYFDAETKQSLTERFHKGMENDGYLFIGHSETIGRKNSLFKYVKPALYQKVNGQ